MFNQTDPLNFGDSLSVTVARNQLQTLKTTGSQARPSNAAPNPVASAGSLTTPNHVQNVQVQVKKTSDVSSKVTVTYQRNPQDYLFIDTRVFVSGYKGNPAPVQVASGVSPVSFSLENTGEPVAVTVQASGNLGQAPLSTAPATTLQLTKTPLATTPTTAGNGPVSAYTFGSSDASLVVTTTGSSVDTTLVPFGKTQPAWWLSGEGSPYPYQNSNGTWGTGTANQIKIWYVRIPYEITVGRITYRHISSLAGSHSALGVYNSSKNKIFSWDNFDTNVGAGTKTTTLGPFTLTPGIYIVACGCDTALSTSAPATQGGFVTIGSSETSQPQNINTVRFGVASNTLSSGAMPATLGTITAAAPGTVIPLFCMEPS